MKGVKIAWTAEMDARLAAEFEGTMNDELAASLGVSMTSLHRRARLLGLTKSATFREDHAAVLSQRISHGIRTSTKVNTGRIQPGEHRAPAYEFKPGRKESPESIARRIPKAAAKRKETLKEERLRYKWGLTQLTRLHVSKQPMAKIHQRSRLRKLGYIVERGSDIAYYTPETKRSQRIESRTRGDRFYFYFDFKPWEGAAV